MPTGFTTVSASALQDATGTAIANATITFTPNGALRAGGSGGQVIDQPVSTTVTNGVFSLSLADMALATPPNVGYKVTAVDNETDKPLLGNGYACFLPTGATYNFDLYDPSLPAGATVPTIYGQILEATGQSTDAISPAGRNLYDPTALRDSGSCIRAANGSIVAISGYGVSALIPVAQSVGKTLVTNIPIDGNAAIGYSFYDFLGNAISPASLPGVGVAVTVPAGAAYYATSMLLSQAKVYIGIGSSVPTPIPSFIKLTDTTGIAATLQALMDSLKPTGANLLDPTTAIANSFVQSSAPDTGGIGNVLANTGTWASADIPVVAGRTLVINIANTTGNDAFGYAFLDSSHQPFSAPTLPTTAGATITVPAGACFVRFSLFNLTANYVGYGTTLPAPIPAYYRMQDLQAAVIALQASTPTLPQVNLADPSQFTTATCIANTNGTLNTGYPAYLSTGYIPVIAGQVYRQNFALSNGNTAIGGAWYDANKAYLSGVAQCAAGTALTAPVGAAFYRTSANWGTGPDQPNARGVLVVQGALPANTTVGAVFDQPGVVPFYLAGSAIARNSGKRMTCIGDSVTNQGGWQNYVAAKLGMTVTCNAGISGASTNGFSNSIANTSGFATAINAALAASDVVAIFLGTNDFTGTDPVSGAGSGLATGSSTDAAGANTVCGQLRYIIEYCYAKNSSLQVVLITPYFSTRRPSGSLLAVCQAIESVAPVYGIPVISLYKLAGLNSLTWSTLLLDGLHPNTQGFEQNIGPLIAGQFEALL